MYQLTKFDNSRPYSIQVMSRTREKLTDGRTDSWTDRQTDRHEAYNIRRAYKNILQLCVMSLCKLIVEKKTLYKFKLILIYQFEMHFENKELVIQ